MFYRVVSYHVDSAALLTSAIVVLPCEAIIAGLMYVALLPVLARVNAQAATIEAPVNDQSGFSCYLLHEFSQPLRW